MVTPLVLMSTICPKARATGFSAYSPDLPGCVATGRTRKAVEKEMRDAIEFHIEGLRLAGEEVPNRNHKRRIVKSPPDSNSPDKPRQDACPTSSDKNISGEHWRWCPQCGHELINEKCKLRCPRCHYFMSCSDFDFAN
jgi:predicted RNase H-like HicB family nuclease